MNERAAKRAVKKAAKSRGRRFHRIPKETRDTVVKMAREGATYREIVAALDVPMGSVGRIVKPLGGVYSGTAVWEPGSNSLTIEERFAIQAGLEAGDAMAVIARRLDRARSTVTREVRARSINGVYFPVKAHQHAFDMSRRPKTTKLDQDPLLAAEVERRLRLLHSPEQIAQRLRMDFPNDPAMRISHETIYQSLFVQARGELKKELVACLRTGRASRVNRNRASHPGPIPNPVPISDRPAEAEDRSMPGHIEGDLVLGLGNLSAVGTLVERATRRATLVLLPGRHDAGSVCEALVTTFKAMPADLARSLTWDRGSEMARHATFTQATGVQVYFCDPHSPWQRPSNENFNGLLRQFFPKGTDLSTVTADRLYEVQELLNNRPRKTLGWRTPNEAYADLVAHQP